MSKWTQEDIALLLKMRAQGISVTDIAARLGRERGVVSTKIYYIDNVAGKPKKIKSQSATLNHMALGGRLTATSPNRVAYPAGHPDTWGAISTLPWQPELLLK